MESELLEQRTVVQRQQAQVDEDSVSLKERHAGLEAQVLTRVMYVYMYMYIFVYVYVFVCVCVCVFVCIHM